jgi:hypothetical protein
MIDEYATGSHMTIRGKKYRQDLKIIQGQVTGNWWRIRGHSLHADDIKDILSARPRVLVIGTGYAGQMRIPDSARSVIEKQEIKIIAEKTEAATATFNRLYGEGQDVAGAFHLTC